MIRIILFSILTTLIFWGLAWLIKHCNLPIENRFLQLWHVLASIVTGFVCLTLYSPFLKLLDFLLQIDVVGKIVTFLVPSFHYELSFMLLVIVLSNILCMLIELIVLFTVKLLLYNQNAYGTDIFSSLLLAIAKRFYSIKRGFSVRKYINEKGFLKGKWHRFFQIAYAVMSLLIVVFSIFILNANFSFLTAESLSDFSLTLVAMLKKIYLLPALSYVIIAEIAYFLQGDSDLDAKNLESDNIPAEEIGSYHELFIKLRDRFSAYHIYAQERRDTVDESIYADIGDDVRERAGEHAKEYENLLRALNVVIDQRSVMFEDAMLDFISGKHILLCDNAYGDSFNYVGILLNNSIIKGKKVLFVCESEFACRQVCVHLESIFKKINVFHSIWNSKTTDKGMDPTGIIVDVLVCTVSDIYDKESFDFWSFSLKEVGVVVVNNTVDFFTVLPRSVREMFLDRVQAINPDTQFIFSSEIKSNNVEVALEKYLDGYDFKSAQPDRIRKICGILVWKSEGMPETEIELSSTLGIEMTVSGFSLQNGVSGVIIQAPDRPFLAYLENLNIVQDQFNIKVGEISSFRTKFDFSGQTAENNKTLSFAFIDDRLNNLVKTTEIWRKFGGREYSLLNIVTKDYMLRDFFADNLDKLLDDSDRFSLFLPENPHKEARKGIIVLFMHMYEDPEGVRLKDVIDLLNNIDVVGPDDTPWDILAKFTKYLVADRNYDTHTLYTIKRTTFYDTEKKTFDTDYFVKLVDRPFYRLVCEYYDLARAVAGENVVYLLKCISADVTNHYLPGMTVAVGMQEYGIEKIENGNVYISRRQFTGWKDYHPITSYVLDDVPDCDIKQTEEQPFDSFKKEYIRFISRKMNVTRKIEGIMILKDGYRFANIESVDVHCYTKEEAKDIMCTVRENRTVLQLVVTDEALKVITSAKQKKTKDPVEPTPETVTPQEDTENDNVVINNDKGELPSRPMKNENTSGMTYDISADTSDEDSAEGASAVTDKEKLYLTLAELFNGFFKTYFPFADNSIVAVTKNSLRGKESVSKVERCLARMIPALEINPEDNDEGVFLIEMSSIEEGYVSNLKDNNWDIVINNFREYLTWLVKAPAEKNWFMFGDSQYPDCFDIESVLALFNAMLPAPPKATGIEVEASSGPFCTFCGKSIANGQGYYLENGKDVRYMCHTCGQHRVSQQDEIFKLFELACDNMRKFYGIELPENINIKLKSARSIRRHTKYTGEGRVLGFYNRKTRSVWIEAGGPKEFTLATMYHELTHIWQFNTPNIKNPAHLPLEVLEGHATYIEVECLEKTGNKRFAKMLRDNYLERTDAYGIGFRTFNQNVSICGRSNAFEAMEAGDPKQWIYLTEKNGGVSE